MEELTFGGNSSKRILGTILEGIASFIKWSSLLLISRSKKISRWLVGKSVDLNINAQKQQITEVKVNLVLRDLKRYKFKCNGKKFHCYEVGDYISTYKDKQKEDLVVTEQDYFYLRYNIESWQED